MKLNVSKQNCVEILHTDVAAAEANRVDYSFADLRSFQRDAHRLQHNTSVSGAAAFH